MIIIHPSSIPSARFIMARTGMKTKMGKKYMHLVPDPDRWARLAARIMRCEL